jgi:ankyrin repeat protein
MTALIYAVDNACIGVIKALLDAEADVNIQDNDGMTALWHAVIHDYFKVVEQLLILEVDKDSIDKDKMTALSIYAVNNGCFYAVKALLDAGCDKNNIKDKIKSLLMDSVNSNFYNKFDTVKQLLDAGLVDKDSLDNHKMKSLLKDAINYNEHDIVKQLIALGVDKDGIGNDHIQVIKIKKL